MEWCELTILAGASSLSDVSNVIYSTVNWKSQPCVKYEPVFDLAVWATRHETYIMGDPVLCSLPLCLGQGHWSPYHHSQLSQHHCHQLPIFPPLSCSDSSFRRATRHLQAESIQHGAALWVLRLELETKAMRRLGKDFTITEKAPTGTFSW